MPIEPVGGAVGTNTATLPSFAVGDVAIVFAFRDGNTTNPTIPGTFNTISNTADGTSCSASIGWRRLQAGDTTVGTWTNASRVSVGVYRGLLASGTPVGTFASAASATTTCTYPAINFSVTNGSSWMLGAAGHRSVNTNLEAAPSGLTNRAGASGVDATAESALHDSGQGLTSWSATSVTLTGTSSGHVQISLELLAAPFSSGGSVAVSAGTLAPSTSVLLTGIALQFSQSFFRVEGHGQAFAFAQGVLGPSVAASLQGIAVSVQQGSVSVPASGNSAGLTGSSVSFSQGVLAQSSAVALQGVSVSFSQGAISPSGSVTASLAGEQTPVASGVLSSGLSVSLTGLSVSFSQGALSTSSSVTASLSGEQLTSFGGLLEKSLSVSLSGLSVSFSQGALSTSSGHSATLSGEALTLASGELSKSLAVSLSGISVSFTQGDLSFPDTRPHGQVIESFTGLVAPQIEASLAGQSLSFSAGTLAPLSGSAATLNGQLLTITAGTIGAASSNALVGGAATFSAGTLTPSSDDARALTGEGFTSTAGTLAPSASVTLTGSVASFATGTLSVGADNQASLTGSAVTLSLGSLGATSSATLSGSEVSFAMGSLTFSAFTVEEDDTYIQSSQGTVFPATAAALQGASASFSTGSLSVGVDGDSRSLTGSAITFQQGTLSASRSNTLAGSLLTLAQGVIAVPTASTLPDITLTSVVGGTQPFTVGLAFRKGDAPDNLELDIANQQVVVMRRWNDGSVKHAIASGRASFTANAPLAVGVLNTTASASGTALTASDIQTAAPSASVEFGSFGTVSLSSLLASPFRTFISGTEMVECHYRGQPNGSPTDATLEAWFHVRLYADGKLWIRAIGSNGNIDITTSDKTYSPLVVIDGTTIWSNGSPSTYTHYAHTRWAFEGWVGTDPQITPHHDTTYLKETKLVPNYFINMPSAATLNALYQTYAPNQNGNWDAYMPATGYQDQIGLIPQWDAVFVTSGADARAYRAVVANSKALNSYSIIYTDSVTRLPVKPSDRPNWSLDGAGQPGGSPPAVGGLAWEGGHFGAGGYLAYIITGDYYHLETMEHQNALTYLEVGPVNWYTDPQTNNFGTSRYFNGQTRGYAWKMRSLSHHVGIAPSSSALLAEYTELLENNILNLQAIKDTIVPAGIGYIYEDNPSLYGPGLVAPWMHHFFIQSLGMGSDLEPLSDMAAYNDVRDYMYRAAVGILGDSAGYYFTEASQYYLRTNDGSSFPPDDFYKTWAEVFSASFPSPPAYGNTLHGTSGGNPSSASGGYWGNLIAAIAYAVDHGAPGADEAWARLTGADNWSTVLASPFAEQPQFGIEPRAPDTDVTDTLSGSVVTFSLGALTPEVTGNSRTLTGSAATFEQGAATPAISRSLTGSAVSFAQGSLSAVPSSAANLSGSAVAISQGAFSTSGSITLAGSAVAFQQGTITFESRDVTVSLLGTSVSISQGSFAPSTLQALLGSLSTFAQGSIITARAAPLSSVSAQFAQGTVLPVGGTVTVSLIGQSISFSQGTLRASGADAPTAGSFIRGRRKAPIKTPQDEQELIIISGTVSVRESGRDSVEILGSVGESDEQLLMARKRRALAILMSLS